MRRRMTWMLVGAWLVAACAQAPTEAGTAASAQEAAQDPAQDAAAGEARVITLTGSDDMKFTPDTIEAAPGERLRIELTTESQMPKLAMAHNFVMLKPGSDENAFVSAAVMARDTDYIPPELKDQVLVDSGLAGGGESVSAEFNAPDEPGEYTFICTFPGHYQAGMVGTLIVK